MIRAFSSLAVALVAAAALTTAEAPQPANAQSQGTVNTLIGAAAAVGALILYNNYQHKQQAANSVVGYTQNGGTIYGDGRIVMPASNTIYPNSSGRYPSGQYAYYSPHAASTTYRYDYTRSGQYDTTHHHSNGHAYGQSNGHAYNNGHPYTNQYNGHPNNNGQHN